MLAFASSCLPGTGTQRACESIASSIPWSEVSPDSRRARSTNADVDAGTRLLQAWFLGFGIDAVHSIVVSPRTSTMVSAASWSFGPSRRRPTHRNDGTPPQDLPNLRLLRKDKSGFIAFLGGEAEGPLKT